MSASAPRAACVGTLLPALPALAAAEAAEVDADPFAAAADVCIGAMPDQIGVQQPARTVRVLVMEPAA